MNGLIKAARRLAWFTIAYNIVEGLVSVAFGVSDGSISLLGFGIDSFVEVFSAIIVLWRLGREFGNGRSSVERERLATRGIGFLLILLAAIVLLNSGLRLLNRVHPGTALPGIVVSLASLSFMSWLYTAKRKIATTLDSRTLHSDAVCSLACIWLSVILMVGSGIYYLWRVWWADSVAAILIAFLVLREGIENIRASYQMKFDGCCCGNCKTRPPTPSRSAMVQGSGHEGAS